MTQLFTGSAVALVTPFTANNEHIDWPAFTDLLDFHLNHKTDALVITGTTGESSTLTDEEQIELIRVAVTHVGGQIPVIAGTGINDTRHAIKLSLAAQEVGADGLLIVTPYYNKATELGMLAHFTAIADAVTIPIILYHVPGRTGANLSPQQVATLANHPNIVGLKDATGDLAYTRAVMALVGPDFALYSGNDDLNYDFIRLGGDGAISVTANILPEEIHDLCVGASSGASAQLNQHLAAINTDLFVEVNPVPVKYLTAKLGLCELVYRLPMCPPSEATQHILDDYLPMIEKYKETN